MATMAAVGSFNGLPIDDPQALQDVKIEIPPELRPRDVLVEVAAVSVNPVDIKRRQSLTPTSTPVILGFDAAGVVTAVGPDVSTLSVGDEVWYAGDISRPGTNAQFHAVDERIVSRKPQSLSFADAAALPLTTITAWESLFDRFELTRESKGDLLIMGAAGGVGSVMIQLAKALTGVRVIGTASRAESAQWATELGADVVINHHDLRTEALAAAPRRCRLGVLATLGGQRRGLRRDPQAVRPRRRDRRPEGPGLDAAENQEHRLALGVHVHQTAVRAAGPAGAARGDREARRRRNHPQHRHEQDR